MLTYLVTVIIPSIEFSKTIDLTAEDEPTILMMAGAVALGEWCNQDQPDGDVEVRIQRPDFYQIHNIELNFTI